MTTKFSLCTILILIAFGMGCQKGEKLSFTCRVEAKYAELSSQFPAKVSEVFVKEGSDVVKGEVLIELDTEELEIQLKAVEREIESYIHEVNKLKAILSQIRKNLKRARDLESVGGAAKINVEEFELKEKTTEEDIKSLNKKIEAGMAKKELLEKKIRDGRITSPSDGRVIEVTVEKGEVAMPGFTLIKLELKGERFARCYASHSALNKVRVNKRVTLKSGDKTCEGTIYFVSSEPEFTPRYFISDNEREILHYEFRVSIPDTSNLANGEFIKVIIPE